MSDLRARYNSNKYLPKVKSWVRLFGFFDPIKLGGLDPVQISNHLFSLREKWIGFFGTLIGLSPYFLAFWVLNCIFKNYCINNIFTLENAKYYQRLGYIFFFNSLFANPLCQALLTAAATLSNPPGQKQITITFGMINLESLFCGAIIIIIARVMYMGNKLQEEQRLVI
jgi:hypothetical protein